MELGLRGRHHFDGGQNPSHVYAAAGSYTVGLTVQRSGGLATTMTRTVDVEITP